MGVGAYMFKASSLAKFAALQVLLLGHYMCPPRVGERERDSNYISKLSAVMYMYLPECHPVALRDWPPQIAGNEGHAHLLHAKKW